MTRRIITQRGSTDGHSGRDKAGQLLIADRDTEMEKHLG
jgi:hypothetical protein